MNRGLLASICDILALISPRVSAATTTLGQVHAALDAAYALLLGQPHSARLRHHKAEPKSGITDCARFAENVKRLAQFLATTPKNR